MLSEASFTSVISIPNYLSYREPNEVLLKPIYPETASCYRSIEKFMYDFPAGIKFNIVYITLVKNISENNLVIFLK